jgi:thiol-disulfide isomerase/thioredoxin
MAWLLALALAASVSAANPPARSEAESYWIANGELRGIRAPAPGAEQPPADTPGDERFGEVYDSADYQYLLLLGGTWEMAFVLDLAPRHATPYPLQTILTPGGDLKKPGVQGASPPIPFAVDEAGRLTFSYLQDHYTIEPQPPMLGVISQQELFARQPVYKRRAGAYAPDPAILARLAEWSEDVEIVAFFGSWCQLCKHHLPSLLKVLQLATNSHLHLTMVALDENMNEPYDWITDWEVGYTPSFIVCIDGAEVGRIEEEPEISIEADLAQILIGDGGR